MTIETAETIVEIIFLGLCLFCANLLLVRRRDPGTYLPLALLFLFQAITSIVFLIAEHYGSGDQFNTLNRISVFFVVFDTFCPFLFWLYVRALTTEGETEQVPKLHYHLAAIAILTLLATSAAFVPEVNEADLDLDHPAFLPLLLILASVTIADILFNALIATYLYLIIRRLRSYQKRLKDVFASTQNRELTWIWAITVSAGCYLVLAVVFTFTNLIGVFSDLEDNAIISFLDSLGLLLLFWVIGLWGLRQRPGLIRTSLVEQPIPPASPANKYEKSALDDQRATRIAKKIEAAMEQDQLYREPDLSLWDLAKHIGVTSHYVSQTLNSKLGSSFFDYINSWRIKDAVGQLTTTDETILVIAYDVGFNSRSAFYKAFKRATGKTPSDLRA